MATHAGIEAAYILAGIFFILGLKGLTKPRTAVRGNIFGSLGMAIAVGATLWDQQILSFENIAAGFLVGGTAGAWLAVRIPMTSMPQLVALLNGTGGLASAAVAAAGVAMATAGAGGAGSDANIGAWLATLASTGVGAVTTTGSFIAILKLQGVGWVDRIGRTSFATTALVGTALSLVGLACALCLPPEWIKIEAGMFFYPAFAATAALLGILLVLPIGGADMPVVIALLNAYSGIAAAATGFALHNHVLVVSGALVGASGLILTQIMCHAMNRSLKHVLFGGLGTQTKASPGTVAGGAGASSPVYEGKITAASVEEAAMIFDGVQKVIIVPGYGMAVSQAQHAVRDLTQTLKAQGTSVSFAIHPVAGRMPGHMNVLLAEADIPYPDLHEMEAVNPEFSQADVALIIGANDVTNPLAQTDPDSPIAGMPILQAIDARVVMVIKRSLSPGFAGIANPLFAAPNTMMLFGDGKKTTVELNNAIKEAA